MSAEKIVLPAHGGLPSPDFDLGETDNNYIYRYTLLINVNCYRTIWHSEKIIEVRYISIDFIVS